MRFPGRVCVGSALISTLAASPLAAQTPSPLANWQYSAGEVLVPLGGPVPDWRIILGGGAEMQPIYEGSQRYSALPSVVFDVRYKDIAFLSDGEGVGVNVLRGPTYRAGLAIAYDLGRNHHVQHRLAGLGNIDPAPEAKLFAEYFLPPFVYTFDLRKGIGGHDGVIGDIGLYVPVPAAKDFYVFTGPSVTFADGDYILAVPRLHRARRPRARRMGRHRSLQVQRALVARGRGRVGIPAGRCGEQPDRRGQEPVHRRGQRALSLLGRELINSEWSADVHFGAHSGLRSDIA